MNTTTNTTKNPLFYSIFYISNLKLSLQFFLPALYKRNGELSWNVTVNRMTGLALEALRALDEQLFDEMCNDLFSDNNHNHSHNTGTDTDMTDMTDMNAAGDKRTRDMNHVGHVGHKDQQGDIDTEDMCVSDQNQNQNQDQDQDQLPLGKADAKGVPVDVERERDGEGEKGEKGEEKGGYISRDREISTSSSSSSSGLPPSGRKSSLKKAPFQPDALTPRPLIQGRDGMSQYKSSGAPSPVTITGVAPWAINEIGAPGAKQSGAGEGGGDVDSFENDVLSGSQRVAKYLLLCKPKYKEDINSSDWNDTQAAPTPTLEPGLKFHSLVFGIPGILGSGSFSTVRYARKVVQGLSQSQWPEYVNNRFMIFFSDL